jgi:hypothetical protein
LIAHEVTPVVTELQSESAMSGAVSTRNGFWTLRCAASLSET